ncbi:hypothetical protein BDQ12DRAFT_510666 [Crucibulum laeve]|uniref:Uncharacterized protein n=1 Tax=Crucibulum laeve TaxID=68775 RepID=A0A5C3M5Y2_9AGAR|nr:hypothetical protein BDQ12DRAFT_510666 [Crucibulum laeve]
MSTRLPPPNTMPQTDLLASLAGVCLLVFIRIPCSLWYQRYLGIDAPSFAKVGTETAREPQLTRMGKIMCILGAVGYLLNTIYVTEIIANHLGTSVFQDTRFIFGRAGMLLTAFVHLLRLASAPSSALVIGELQADALLLISIPYVMGLLNTPPTAQDFPQRLLWDSLIAPALGFVCFVGARQIV